MALGAGRGYDLRAGLGVVQRVVGVAFAPVWAPALVFTVSAAVVAAAAVSDEAGVVVSVGVGSGETVGVTDGLGLTDTDGEGAACCLLRACVHVAFGEALAEPLPVLVGSMTPGADCPSMVGP